MAYQGMTPADGYADSPGGHSTLEAVEYSGLEPVPQYAPPIVVAPESWKEATYVQQQNWTETGQNGGYEPPAEAPAPRQKILGLSVKAFWTGAVILIVLLIAAIGGGIGGGLAARNRSAEPSSAAQADAAGSSSSWTTASPTDPPQTGTTAGANSVSPTTSSPTATATGAVINVNCPAKNGTSYTAIDSQGNGIKVKDATRPQSFVRLCNTNYPGGEDNGEIQDLQRITEPNMEDCIAACAQYNAANYGRKELCSTAVMDRSWGYDHCYLKSGKGRNVTAALSSLYEAAIMIDLGV